MTTEDSRPASPPALPDPAPPGAAPLSDKDQIIKVIRDENEATRAHIANEISTLHGDTSSTKHRMDVVIKWMKKIMRTFGLSADE